MENADIGGIRDVMLVGESPKSLAASFDLGSLGVVTRTDRRIALIQRRANLPCGVNLGEMQLYHATINVIDNVINDTEQMNLNNTALSNAYSTTNGLMHNSGIPMLRKKQDALTEL